MSDHTRRACSLADVAERARRELTHTLVCDQTKLYAPRWFCSTCGTEGYPALWERECEVTK